MSPPKSYRKPKRAKRAFKKRSKRSYTTRVPRNLGPIAPRAVVSMRYNQLWQQSASVPDYMFNLNSLFDVDKTGGGHQPYGHDTFSTLYNRYRVFAVSGHLNISSAAAAIVVKMIADNYSSAHTNMTLVTESPNSKSVNLAVNQTKRIPFKFYLPKINGSTVVQYKADDRFQAMSGSSPAELIVLHILGTDAIGAGTNQVYYDLVLNFHCEWFDPYLLTQS